MDEVCGFVPPELLGLPVLLMNMGGEMVYILQQRLQAQQIGKDKSARVLQEVVSAMFSHRFVAELFKPQAIYSNFSVRQVFTRLAHSSIMRLNESSMDKLYDLMTMGFKYQLQACRQPKGLLHCTLNHLDNVSEAVKDATGPYQLVQRARRLTGKRYGSLTDSHFYIIRQSLAQFLQDRRVKVSLFLKEKIQTSDGVLIVEPDGMLPEGYGMPGVLKYYESADGEPTEARVNMERFDHMTPFDAQASVTLGSNLYARNAQVPQTEQMAASADKEAERARDRAAERELDLLAALVQVDKSPTKSVNDGSPNSNERQFISIRFGATHGSSSDSSSKENAPLNRTQQSVVFQHEKNGEHAEHSDLQKRLKGLDLDTASPQKRAVTEDDDLLDLIDEV